MIEKAQKKAQITEGVVTGRCQIEGHDTVIAIMDSHFMMGSMGSVVGEKVTRAVDTRQHTNCRSLFLRRPVVPECRRGSSL